MYFQALKITSTWKCSPDYFFIKGSNTTFKRSNIYKVLSCSITSYLKVNTIRMQALRNTSLNLKAKKAPKTFLLLNSIEQYAFLFLTMKWASPHSVEVSSGLWYGYKYTENRKRFLHSNTFTIWKRRLVRKLMFTEYLSVLMTSYYVIIFSGELGQRLLALSNTSISYTFQK